jgi:hypothetical protein
VSRHRFGIAYLALAAILGTAVGLFVVLATRDSGHSADGIAAGPSWSAWQPTTTGTLGVREIARHVGSQYELADGQQLVGVVGGPMQVPSTQGAVPVGALLVSSGHAGVEGSRISIAYPQAGVFFQLCGEAASCQIPGTATTKRGTLLFREVVELALYTYRYLPQADHVIAFLPPAPGVPSTDPRFHRAVYLPRSSLARSLTVPLNRTLEPLKVPILPASLSAEEQSAISGFVAPRVYHYDFQQAADNSVLVLLSPIEP